LFGANFRGASSWNTDAPSSNFCNTVLGDSLFHRAIFASTFYLDATTVGAICTYFGDFSVHFRARIHFQCLRSGDEHTNFSGSFAISREPGADSCGGT
jgi:hypothetical protein